MATRIYGASDDLIEFEGDVRGESGCYDRGCLIFCSDGTLLMIKYGDDADRGIFKITVLRKGDKLEGVEPCEEEDSTPHSDVANFSDGLKWAYVASEWERAK